tara:strand:+ start:2053 stop:3630 length:1578 start_codon:yes stop_codon:yes gene_type:complete
MGIPAYFSHIVKQHKDIIKKFNKDFGLVDNLLLDCNSIIYDCIRSIDSKNNFENILIKSVCTKIEDYIKDIKPTNTVYIAFDGVAPVAKLEQQRTRRYKSHFTNNIINSFKNAKTSYWDTTNITPGTNFMNKLSKYIHNYFNDSRNFNVKNLIISTSTSEGEGEHKLFSDIRKDNDYLNQKTVIYGLDADLIMLSLNHRKYCKEIYLFRETPEFIKHIDSSLSPNLLYVMDINILADELTKSLNNNTLINKEYQKNRIHDYIFICFMLGNDFIPHIPCINIRTHGITHLMDAYKIAVSNHNENITDGTKINWSIFRKFIKHLSDNELDYYNLEYKSRHRQSKRYFPSSTPEECENKFLNLPIQNRTVEVYINPGEEYWKNRYYKKLFDVNYEKDIIKEICINYLEALEWTFKYYTIGCKDWSWCYKYHYPPLMSDLLKYIPYFDTEFIKKKSSSPVAPIVQLSYVLPRKSLDILPSKIQNILLSNVPEYYSDNWNFQWAFCKYFWESHIEMYPIDLEKLNKLLCV